jgi:aryl-alcohol dehydrogenase-like predicted oxidoreductase
VLAQGAHIHVIPGTASIAHLQENMDTLNLSVSQKLLDELSALINQSTVAGHRYAPAMRKAIDTEEF